MYFMPDLSGSKPDRLHSLPPSVTSSLARYRPSRRLCVVLSDVPPSFRRATVLSVSLEMSGAYPTAQRGKRLRESLKQASPYLLPGRRKRRALGRLRAIWRHTRDTARHIIPVFHVLHARSLRKQARQVAFFASVRNVVQLRKDAVSVLYPLRKST